MTTRDPRNWMWAEACELLDRAERLKREFFRPAPRTGHSAWQPPVDLFETSEEVWVLVALPGVPRERVEARVDGGTLVVTGERLLPAAVRRAVVHRLEIPHGRFERRIELPPGHYERRGQDLVDGCLVLNLKKLF
jgi:HSP20 family molecular chaperone IbpA